MKTLIVERDGSLAVREINLPRYNDCQALVKTVSCGICNGTDAKLIHRTFKNFGAEKYPLMLGHEAVGRVVEVGKKVKKYKVGDVVLLPFVDPQDGYDSGWGAFGEYGVVCDETTWDEAAFGPVPECAFAQTVLPEWVDPVDGAMIITLREVLSSIRRFGISAGDSVAVFGCGPVGLTFVKFMKLLGVKPVIALDIVPEKLEEAKALGADAAFLSNEATYRDEIRSICPDGVKFVLDAVGVSRIMNMAMPLLRDQGKICCYGISPNLSAEIDWTEAPYNWGLQFQQFPAKPEEGAAHEQVMAWIKDGVIDLKDYISDYFAFDEILTAFDRLAEKKIAKKGIVYYESVRG